MVSKGAASVVQDIDVFEVSGSAWRWNSERQWNRGIDWSREGMTRIDREERQGGEEAQKKRRLSPKGRPEKGLAQKNSKKNTVHCPRARAQRFDEKLKDGM